MRAPAARAHPGTANLAKRLVCDYDLVKTGGRRQKGVVHAFESTVDNGLFKSVHRDLLEFLSCVDGREHQCHTGRRRRNLEPK